MNYFGHTVLAVRWGGTRAFVLGSMLPDFASMIGARPPRTDHVDIDSGMRFHWKTDDAFHQAPAFQQLTHQAVAVPADCEYRIHFPDLISARIPVVDSRIDDRFPEIHLPR